jgi:hypothetical protein
MAPECLRNGLCHFCLPCRRIYFGRIQGKRIVKNDDDLFNGTGMDKKFKEAVISNIRCPFPIPAVRVSAVGTSGMAYGIKKE